MLTRHELPQEFEEHLEFAALLLYSVVYTNELVFEELEYFHRFLFEMPQGTTHVPKKGCSRLGRNQTKSTNLGLLRPQIIHLFKNICFFL